jgi:diadenylate cyclase
MIIFQLPIGQIILNVIIAFFDILIITYIFFKFYQILSQTRAFQVFRGLLIFIVLFILARLAQLETFSWLLDQVATVLVIAIIILFQPELRRVLTKLGQSSFINNIIKKDPRDLKELLQAIENFHILHVGALIVFERTVGLKNIIETGTVLNSRISAPLLMTLFNTKTPLHDGAIIIHGDRVVAAGCFLPLSDSNTIKQDFGTRHRAALGVAEESDAVVVVVSEETGRISLAYDGRLYTQYEVDILKDELVRLLNYDDEGDESGEEKI